MGIVAIWKRFRYYQSSLGGDQTAKLYASRALRRRSIDIRVRSVPHTVACRPTEADRYTICHVFVERDCEVPVALDPQLVVDAGANVGYASVWYANRFPEATIVGIEPDRGNLAVAERNCASYPQIQLWHAGLWPRDVPLRVIDPGRGSWGFQVREAVLGELDVVEGVSIPTLLERSGHDRIGVLKLDIEGGETPLFSSPGSQDWLPSVDVVLVETHGEESEQAVSRAMSEASFTLVERRPARGDVYVNSRFDAPRAR